MLPDTNALLYNPALEDWRIPDLEPFVVILLPSVIRDLDRFKVEYRNEDVRTRAEGLITRFKGYRQRRSLADGVPLRRHVSSIRALAVEPRVAQTLPWLDAATDDDRIIASFIEVLRQHPRTTAVLVTRDFNLQNKLEFARLPFIEPPPPAGGS